MNSLRWLSTAMFAAVLTSVASAASISINPARDNTLIQQTNPATQLSNGLGDLFSGRTNQDADPNAPGIISIRRSLVFFDVATIPAGSTIKSVSLTMRDVQQLNGDRVTSLHRALADWGEGTSYQAGGMGAPATQNDATWLYRFYNSSNPAASPTWTTPGGDFDPVASASTTILAGNPNGRFYTWTSPGLVADVQSWLDNPAANFGWLIRGDESRGQTAKRLDGRTIENAPNPNAPVLVITYAIPEPGAAIIAAITACSLFVVRRSSR
jgi:hypothetical protein